MYVVVVIITILMMIVMIVMIVNDCNSTDQTCTFKNPIVDDLYDVHVSTQSMYGHQTLQNVPSVPPCMHARIMLLLRDACISFFFGLFLKLLYN